MPKGVYEHKQHGGMFKVGSIPHNKGIPLSDEHKEKISKANRGRKYSEEVLIKMREGQKLRFKTKQAWNKGLGKKVFNCLWCKNDFTTNTKTRKYCSHDCYVMANSGENNYRYIKDRKLVRLDIERGGPLHKEWSKKVKNRDGWKCKLNNHDCLGKLVAHHILSWKDYPDLRYEVSNGITLCKKHHPLKRKDELENISFFKSLIN